MLIEDVNNLCKLFGKGEFEVEDLGSTSAWCFEAKGILEDGSFYQFRVSEGLFMVISLFSNGSGLLRRLSAIVSEWCKDHDEITIIDGNANPDSKQIFLKELPEGLTVGPNLADNN